MDAVIYLEADEEITSVIDKLKRSKSPVVGIVAPRNAVLLQSIVNLKLLKKESEKFGKDISLVTADSVGQNLALRTGLTVYKNIHDTEPIPPLESVKPQDTIEMEESSDVVEAPVSKADLPQKGFRVHHYMAGDEEGAAEESVSKEPEFSSKTIGELQAEAPAEEEIPIETGMEKSALEETTRDTEGKPTEPIIIEATREEPPEEKVAAIKKDWEQYPKKNIEEPGTFRKKWWHKKHVIAAIFSIALVFGAGLFVVFMRYPKVIIRLTIEAESFSKTFNLTVSKDQTGVNAEDKIIAGRLLESIQEKTSKIQATGKKDIGVKATGTMEVINETGIDQSFEAGVAFHASSSGLVFRADEAFTVPKATLDTEGNKVNGTITINVTADKSGSDYNIDATSYTITSYTKVYGEGSAMTGGETRVVTIVAQEDIKKGKKTIATELYALAAKDLKQKATGAILENHGIQNEITEYEPSVQEGDEAEEFNLTVKTKSSGLIYDQSSLDQIIEAQLVSTTPQGKKLLPDNEATTTVKSAKPQSGEMIMQVKAVGYIGTVLDETILKQSLFGKNESEAEAVLRASQGVQNIDITFSPSWWLKKIPKDAKKIDLDVHYQPKKETTDTQ